MIGGLLRHILRFPHQRGKGPEITREIMTTFSAGFALGVRLAGSGKSGPVSKSQAKPPAPPTRINSLRSRVGKAFSLPEAPERYREAVQSLPWHQRSFYCEGYAMGRAARRVAFGEADDAFVAARFIGYGFWNGVASHYHLPTVDAPSSPLVADGASYGRILSRRSFHAGELARIRAIANAEDREAAFHGAGRVLWLLYMYNYPALREQLDACGGDREAVERGVGFAIGFIHASDAHEIPLMLAEFGPAAARGAGIALALHTVHDPESCRAVTAQLRGELLEIVESARRIAPEYWGLKNRR